MPRMTVRPVPVTPGVPTTIQLAPSEVCCHLGVAGHDMQVVLICGLAAPATVQLYHEGRPFSFPILAGEAGIYRGSQGGWYALRRTEV